MYWSTGWLRCIGARLKEVYWSTGWLRYFGALNNWELDHWLIEVYWSTGWLRYIEALADWGALEHWLIEVYWRTGRLRCIGVLADWGGLEYWLIEVFLSTGWLGCIGAQVEWDVERMWPDLSWKGRGCTQLRLLLQSSTLVQCSVSGLQYSILYYRVLTIQYSAVQWQRKCITLPESTVQCIVLRHILVWCWNAV